jgi:hypothetical protein
MGHANTSANDALATMTPASGDAPAKIRALGQGFALVLPRIAG